MKHIISAALLCATAIPAFAQAPMPQQRMVACPSNVLVDALNMINEPNKYRDGVISEGMQLMHCLQPPVTKPAEKPVTKPVNPTKGKPQ